MSILIIADHDNRELMPATLKAITAGAQLSGDIHILVAGSDCYNVAQQAACVKGVDKVLSAENAVYEHHLAENLAKLVVSISDNYSHILASSTSMGKNVLPRVAAVLDVAQLSDVTEIKSEDTFVRPIYAGNAIATVQSSDPIKVLTIRITSFPEASINADAVQIEVLSETIESHVSRFLNEELTKSDRPELTSAKVVISGGRGMGSGENFQLLQGIADKLGAAVGASRAAVDAGFALNDLQVGQTGKTVAPDLYIAVGISGAIQHLAGMKDSKVIVAINKDEDAPIFQVADYGLVEDLFVALPNLEKALE
ncbi:FAD-binding protein [Marinomonas sp. C2222]|uniref:FAD-binding protein n=1 Tax=Marinomonas sargassi TaxID=2984494 RepID=A0ABT2YRV6_9GAMM|nr:FAD-binding protein [Marinomonas sargassi]MCV2402632.1 FAD-binding protein [Marinomonas sargassi]